MTDPTRRLFLAVPLPDEIRLALDDYAARLRKAAMFTRLEAKWVDPANYHITLVFLGSVAYGAVEPLADAMRRRIAGIEPFDARIGGIGYFPHAKAPKVLWAGTTKAAEPLKALHQAALGAARDAGLEPEHGDFHAHVTLARFRSLKGTGAFAEMAKSQKPLQAGGMVVDRVRLYESLLGPEGPQYKGLADAMLGGGGQPAPV